jgi:chromosome segregation ATPase
LNWWPHLLYRLDIEKIIDHEEFALTEKNMKSHESYVLNELKQMKDFEKKLEELLAGVSGVSSSVAETTQALQEENAQLKEKLESIQT